MQPDSTLPSPGRVAFRYGLITGLILAVVEAIIRFIITLSTVANIASNSTTSSPLGLGSSLFSIVLGIVAFLLSLVAYFVVGILSSRRTGRVSTGVFAGMWTGGIYGLIGCIVTIVLFFAMILGPVTDFYNRTIHSVTEVNSFRSLLIGSTLIGSILGIALAIGWGAGLGALGGLIGRSSWRAKHPQPLYPGQAYPGQPYPPQYPAYPGYPAYPLQQSPQGYPPQYAPPPWPSPPSSYQPQRGDAPIPSSAPRPPAEKSGEASGTGGTDRTQIDRSYHPPEPADRTQIDRSYRPSGQEELGAVPQPGPEASEPAEPDNPYAS